MSPEAVTAFAVFAPSEDPVLAASLAAGQSVVREIDGSTSGALATLGAVGMRWVMVVPIELRETTMGSFTFATADPVRRYDETDMSTAEVVAQRAAKAIDNGRLHREIQRLVTHEQERVAELESVVRTIGEGIVVCSADGRVRVLNQAARQMLGGTIATQLELRERLGEHGKSLPEPGVAYGPVEFHLVERPTAWVELTAYPVQSEDAIARSDASALAVGDGTGRTSLPATTSDDAGVTSEAGGPTAVIRGATVYVLRDVTAFRQGQSLREAFLGLLSHELRTPVTTIYAAANVLGRPVSTLDAETRGEILHDMVAESDRLYRLVEDLMVLARFDEHIELVRDPGLLQHLVSGVLESERPRWPAVTFEFEPPPSLPAVAGDDTSIQQVVRNLLSNAAKYSPAGSQVTIAAVPEDGGVALRVLDHGPGIQPSEADELFDPFYRSPTTARLASGAGIGLYVSRRLMDAMGGRIWAKRRPGGGSEFGFWLPQFGATSDETDGLPDEPMGEPIALDTHL